MQVWSDMREEGVLPNLPLYHTALASFRKSGHLWEFFKLFEEMRNSGMVPDLVLFNMAIHFAAKNAQVEKAFDLYREMVRLGLSTEAQTYGSLLYACSRVKDFDRAVEVVADMVKAGHTPNEHIFTEFVNSCATKEHLDQVGTVLDWVSQQNKDNKQINLLAPLNCIIGKCIEVGATEAGMEWFKKLTESESMKPDSRTFFSIIRGCVLAPEPQYDLAMQMFGEMKAQGIEPSAAIYEFLLQQAQEVQRLDACFSVLGDMLSKGMAPQASVWGLLFSAACVKSQKEVVSYLWDQMKKHNVPLSVHTMRQFKQFCKQHMPERFHEARAVMLKLQPTPPPRGTRASRTRASRTRAPRTRAAA